MRRSLRQILGRRALDWARCTLHAGRSRAPRDADIVVPVWRALDDLAACVESVARHTDLERERLVVIVDGDRDFAGSRAQALLASLPGNVTVVVEPERRGFVARANEGMSRSDADVVLLNSDTVVTRGWLGKLRAAAYSAPAIASASPFCNNATICSLPRFLEANAIPAGFDVDSFAALVESCSERRFPPIPTAVGVCMYIRRQAIEELGGFDEAAFGLGYGEENDWSFRALKSGWRHVLDDATFIYHAGQRSFGPARGRLVGPAQRVLGRRHPEYVPTIARFIAEDPLAEARGRVVARLAPRRRGGSEPPLRVVHLVHGWPPFNQAGTEVYARQLALRQAGRRDVFAYARIADPRAGLGQTTELLDGGIRVRLVVNNFTERNPLVRNGLVSPILERDFARFLAQTDPDVIHVHHLAGHAASLMQVAAARRVPIVAQVQDWWAVCGRANLFDGNGLCPGPSLGRCSRCVQLTAAPGRSLLNPLLHGLRRRALFAALRRADVFVMGSRFIEASYRGLGLIRPEDRALVLDYGVDCTAPASGPRPVARPLRLGFIGSIMPHKGLHLAAMALSGRSAAEVTLDAWGDASVDPAYTARVRALVPEDVLRIHPRFPDAEKGARLAALDVLLVPSVGLESYGIVAREALACGTPVVAARRGALAELRLDGGGAHFDPDDAAALRRVVDRLLERPEIAGEWRAALPRVRSFDEHFEEVETLLAELAAGRRRR